jgi:hypothetical protein
MKRTKTIGVFLVASITAATATLIALTLRRARLRKNLDRDWRNLQPTTPATTLFSPSLVAHLPEPVQRYFTHAIAPGTPLVSSVTLKMHGDIKLGERWVPYTANQILSPFRGFIWSTRATLGRLWIEGADSYTQEQACMSFALFGLIPVISVCNDDVRRSGAGRLAGESCWLPAALLPERGVAWAALDDTHIQATIPLENEPITLNFTIDEDGRVQEIVLHRWHTDERCHVPFGFVPTAERTFGGYTIPSQAHAGWWYGTARYEHEGKFFACTLTDATYGADQQTRVAY